MCWELWMEWLHVTFGEGSLGEFSCFEEVTQGCTELAHWLSLPSLCGKKPPALHAAIPPQCHWSQSSWHDHVCQVTLDCATQPKRCLKMWRTCINYNGKHLEQSFIRSLTSCMRREPVLGRSSFFNYTKVLFVQTNVVSLWKCLFCHPYLSPSVAFKFSWSMIPADFPQFPRIWVFFLLMDQIFFPLKNVHYPHAILCFTCCFKMVIIGLQTYRWGRTKHCFVYSVTRFRLATGKGRHGTVVDRESCDHM